MTLEVVKWASAIIGLVAAALAVRAATVKIREQLNFHEDIRRQSFWATWAALATAATALLLVAQTFLE